MGGGRLQDAIRQFSLVQPRERWAEAGAGQVLFAHVRDPWLTHSCSQDSLVPRWQAYT